MNRSFFLTISACFFAFVTFAGNPSAVWMPDNGDETYTNPIIFADYSDPDVCRAGKDYYMTASSFNCTPGLPILHSNDLVNWSIVGHAIDDLEPSDFYDIPKLGLGVYAPSIRYHNKYFYIYWGDPDFGIYMVRTKNPRGKWETPIMVKKGKGFIDPCPLWDNNGNVYLIHALAGSRIRQSSLLIVNKLSKDGTSVIDGQGRVVYSGHGVNPTIEGPKLYKHGGWYWIFAPAGGVGNGWQLAMRSKDIYGPYDSRIVLARGTTNINGPHQGGWVTTPNGKEDWFIHFQDKGVYGRIIHLQPMTWRSDGWPVIGIDKEGTGTGEPVTTFKKPNVGKTYPVAAPQQSDEFNSRTIGVQWQWNANSKVYWYYPAGESGFLRLFPVVQPEGEYGNLLDCPNLLLQKFPAEEFTVVTKINFNPSPRAVSERGGLIITGSDYAGLILEKTSSGVSLSMVECREVDQKKKENVMESVNLVEKTSWLRTDIRKGGKCTFFYSNDGMNFTQLGSEFSARKGRWIGAKTGLFVIRSSKSGAGGWMDVDYFRFSRLTN